MFEMVGSVRALVGFELAHLFFYLLQEAVYSLLVRQTKLESHSFTNLIGLCVLTSDTLPYPSSFINTNFCRWKIVLQQLWMDCQFWSCFSFRMAIYYILPTAYTKYLNLEDEVRAGCPKLGLTTLRGLIQTILTREITYLFKLLILKVVWALPCMGEHYFFYKSRYEVRKKLNDVNIKVSFQLLLLICKAH